MARRQPVASDLRFIATALKLVTDLERIGDLCVNVWERVVELDTPPARVIESDETVDKTYVETFQTLLDQIRREPSAAQDGTRLQSIARYLERMGDHATNVAEMVIFMVQGTDVRHPGRLAT